MRHQSFLEYKKYRYLKAAAWLCVLAVALYLWHRINHFHSPGQLAYGSTWVGYGLGSLGAVLMLWLTWLGVRKRSYGYNSNTQAWLSAHVYLGCALVVVVTLHSGFELGWNTHSLAYLLMLLVVGSGIYGVLVFFRVPARLTELMGDDTVPSLLLQIDGIDAQAHALALKLPDEFNALVEGAARNTRLQATVLSHIFNSAGNHCATERAVSRLEVLNKNLGDESARLGRELFGLMVRRQSAVNRIRRNYRLVYRLRLWLLFHVPLSVALLFAVAAHIVSVFIYW